VGTFILVLVVTSEVRSAVDRQSVSIALITFLYLLANGLGLVLMRFNKFVNRTAWGPPAFDELGGVDTSLMRATMKSAKQLRLEFDPSDAEVADALAELDLEATEGMIKQRFTELMSERDPDAAQDDIEDRWTWVWENEILGYRIDDVAFREVFGPPAYASNILFFKLANMRQLLLPAFLLYQVILVVLVYRTLSGATDLLTVLQVWVALSFALSMLIFLNHTKGLGQLDVLAPLEGVPESTKEKWEPLIGTRLIPVRVSVTSSYFGVIGRYFARAIAFNSLLNAAILMIFIAISLAVGTLLAPDSRGDLVSWYGKLALVFAVIPVGMLAAHFVATVLIEHLRQIAAIVVGGLVTALLPVGLEYLAKGQISSGWTTIASSAIAGVVGALAAGLGTQLTNRASSAPIAREAQLTG
jgi:hypothetical protein